jgi:hypothetical protein
MAGQLKPISETKKEPEADKNDETTSISHSIMRTEITEEGEEENELDSQSKIKQNQAEKKFSQFKMPEVNFKKKLIFNLYL